MTVTAIVVTLVVTAAIVTLSTVFTYRHAAGPPASMRPPTTLAAYRRKGCPLQHSPGRESRSEEYGELPHAMRRRRLEPLDQCKGGKDAVVYLW